MSSFRTLIAVVLLFTAGTSAMAQTKIDFTEFDLPNGLHVILHQDNSTPIVAVTISYHVGSKNESPDRTGFAHFFEHLMFEGSVNIPRGQFDKIAMNAGGQINANTSWDRTFYYILLPSNQLELGLWMESERLLHLRIDSTGVETQRRVVKEERKQSYDNRPYGSLIEKTFSTAYKVHPYRWTPIGSAQYIDEARLEEFIEFHSRFYVPTMPSSPLPETLTPLQPGSWLQNTSGIFPKAPKRYTGQTLLNPNRRPKSVIPFTTTYSCRPWCRPTTCLPWERPTIMPSVC